MSRYRSIALWVLAFAGALVPTRSAGAPQAQNPAAEELEFFEKRIRPILAEKCYACHGPQSKSPFGGLRVDSREAILRGGDSGPVIELRRDDPGNHVILKKQ